MTTNVKYLNILDHFYRLQNLNCCDIFMKCPDLVIKDMISRDICRSQNASFIPFLMFCIFPMAQYLRIPFY